MSGASDQTYWILDKRQLQATISSRRHDIVDRLAASGPLSIRELADQIGAQPSGLYHHIEKLLKVGLVVEAGSRVVNRRRERLYGTPARRMRGIGALSANKYPKIISDIVAGITRQMARDFAAGIGTSSKAVEGEGRNLGFFRLVGRPSPAQLARINANLAEILEVFYASSGNDHPRISLGWVMAPVGTEDGSQPTSSRARRRVRTAKKAARSR